MGDDTVVSLGIDPKDIKSLEAAQAALTRFGTAAGLTDKQLASLSASVEQVFKNLNSLSVAKSPFSQMAATADTLSGHLIQANAELKHMAQTTAALAADKGLVERVTYTKSLMIAQQQLNEEIEKQAALKAQLREKSGVHDTDIELRRAKERTAELEKQVALTKELSLPARRRLRREEMSQETGMADIKNKAIQAGKDLREKEALETDKKRKEQIRSRVNLLKEEKSLESGLSELRSKGIEAGKDLRAAQTRNRINLLLEEQSVERGMAELRSKAIQTGEDLSEAQIRSRINLLLEEGSVERGLEAIRASAIQAGKDLRAIQTRKRIDLLLEERSVEKGLETIRSSAIQAGKDLRSEQIRKRINLLLAEKEVERGINDLRSKGVQAGKDLRAAQTRKRINLLLEERSVEKGISELRESGAKAGKDLREAQIRKRINLLLEEKSVEKGMADLRERGIAAGVAKREVELTKATKELTKVQQVQRGAIRGLAGGMGKLWLSYGQGTIAIAAMGAAYAVTRTAVEQFNEAVELDYLTRYAAAIDDTTSSFVDLSNKILEIKGVASSPVELAGGLRELTKAGVDTQMVFDEGLLKTLSKFSSVAEQDLSKAIQLAVTQVNAFGDVTKDSAGYILDYAAATEQMAAAVFSAPISFEDLTNSLQQTTELAVSVRASFDEVVTAIAIIGEAGIKGSKAGTALRTALTRLVTPTEDITAVFKAAGVSIKDAFDEKGNIDVKKALGLFKEVFTQLDATSRVKFAKDTFGLRAQKILAIVNNLEEWDEKHKHIVDSAGSIDDAYEKLSDSFKIASKEFKAAFSRESLEGILPIINMITPAIKLATDNMESLIDKFIWVIENAPGIGPILQFSGGVEDIYNLPVLDSVKEKASGIWESVASSFDDLDLSFGEDIIPESLAENAGEVAEAVKWMGDESDVSAYSLGELSIAAIEANKEYVKLKASVGSLMSKSDWSELEKISSFDGLKVFSGKFISSFADESSTSLGKLGIAFDELTLKSKEYFEASPDDRKKDVGKAYFKAMEDAAKAYASAQREVVELNREIANSQSDLDSQLRSLSRENMTPMSSRKDQMKEIAEFEGRAEEVGSKIVSLDRESPQYKQKYNDLLKEQLELLGRAKSLADGLGSSAIKADKGLVSMAKAEVVAANAALGARNIQQNRTRSSDAKKYLRELTEGTDDLADAKRRLLKAERAVESHNTSQTRAALKSASENYTLVKSLKDSGVATDKLSVAKLKLSYAEKKLAFNSRDRSKEVRDARDLAEAEEKLARLGRVMSSNTNARTVSDYREAYKEYEKLYNAQKSKGDDSIAKEAALKDKMEEVRRVAEEILNVKKQHSEEIQKQIGEQAGSWGLVSDTTKKAEESVKGYGVMIDLATKKVYTHGEALKSILGESVMSAAKAGKLFNIKGEKIETPEVDSSKLEEAGNQMEAVWSGAKESVEKQSKEVVTATDTTSSFKESASQEIKLVDGVWTNLTSSVKDYIVEANKAAAIKLPSSTADIPARKLGGDVKAYNPYIVGEAGKELFIPNTSGTIIPNNSLESHSKNSGNKQVDINLNFGEEQVQLQGTEDNVELLISKFEKLNRRAA